MNILNLLQKPRSRKERPEPTLKHGMNILNLLLKQRRRNEHPEPTSETKE